MKIQRVEYVGEYHLIYVRGPQEIKVFVMGNLLRRRVFRQLFEHHLDVDKAVTATPEQNDRSFDILRREFRNFVVAASMSDTAGALDLVVEHLKRAVADDLEPMDHTFGRGEREEVRVGCKFLMRRDVACLPAEKEGQ